MSQKSVEIPVTSIRGFIKEVDGGADMFKNVSTRVPLPLSPLFKRVLRDKVVSGASMLSVSSQVVYDRITLPTIPVTHVTMLQKQL